MLTPPKTPPAPAARIEWLDDGSNGLRGKLHLIRQAIRGGWPMSAEQRDHILATLDKLATEDRSSSVLRRIAETRDLLSRHQVTG